MNARTVLPVRVFSTLLLFTLLVVAVAVAAPAAGAAPSDTMSLGDLQAKLVSGSVDATMKTCVSGTGVSDIDVSIIAVIDGFESGKLIMFESSDPTIIDNGGVAAGMSGSPIYVDDAGTDKLVGAVSYGNWFALKGAGLATPIEYMTAVQDGFGAVPARARTGDTIKLRSPVRTSWGVISQIVLSKNGQSAKAVSDGVMSVHPLAVARIGGVSSSSAAYRNISAIFDEQGIKVLPAQSAPASAATTPDLVAGSPCGVLVSTGSYTIGVLGTVTYVDGHEAMLFGHPIMYGPSYLETGIGPMNAILTGATVEGIWPSSEEPYKMMTPADVKGAASQDRSAGVLATVGVAADTYPVTTTGSFNGGAEVVTETDLGAWYATVYWPDYVDEWGWTSYGATSYVAAAGLSRALDCDPMTGSAETTTTVVASDGAEDYTFTRHNIWDNDGNNSSEGLSDVAAGDVTSMVAAIMKDSYGTRNVSIKSVDVDASFSSERKSGGIADVNLPRALRPGDNEVVVTYYHYGSSDPQTAKATLIIPKGTSISGDLEVMSASYWSESFGDYWDEAAKPPETLADTKATLDALPQNGDIVVVFMPYSNGDDEDYYYEEDEISTTAPVGWVNSGSIYKWTEDIDADASPSKVTLGKRAWLSGDVESASDDVPVSIYCQSAGQAEPTEPTLMATAEYAGGEAQFDVRLPAFKHTTVVTAEVASLSDNTVPGAAQSTVKVKADLSLSVRRRGSRLLAAAQVLPKDAGGKVEFQRRTGRRWITVATVDVGSAGRASARVKAAGTSKIRACFPGSDMNAAGGWVVWPAR